MSNATKSPAQTAYEAYAKSTDSLTWDKKPMPTWEQICDASHHVALAWTAAALAVMLGGETEGLTFSDALDAAKAGKRIARAGWNGKSMWVALTPGSTIPVGLARDGAALKLASEKVARAKDLHDAEAQTIAILPHLDMRAADGSLVIGWLASQTDMLANDWVVLDP